MRGINTVKISVYLVFIGGFLWFEPGALRRIVRAIRALSKKAGHLYKCPAFYLLPCALSYGTINTLIASPARMASNPFSISARGSLCVKKTEGFSTPLSSSLIVCGKVLMPIKLP